MQMSENLVINEKQINVISYESPIKYVGYFCKGKGFLSFVNLANKSYLHPLDMRRFYNFIRLCHARRVKLDQFQLQAYLEHAGFDEDIAKHLSTIYYHGRELLRFGRVPIRKDS